MIVLAPNTEVEGNRLSTDLFAEPQGPVVGDLVLGQKASVVTQTSERLFTQIDFGDGSLPVWVRTEDLDVAGVPQVVAVVFPDFVEDAIAVAQAMNELPDIRPSFVSVEYLLARATFESGPKLDAGAVATPSAAAPMGMTASEWSRFLASSTPLSKGYAAADRRLPLAQIRAAAWTALGHSRAFAALRAKPGPDEVELEPSYLDLTLAQLLGDAAKVEKLSEIAEVAPATPLSDALPAILSAPELAAFLAERAALVAASGTPPTVASFIAAVEARVDAALLQAVALIRQHVPLALPPNPDPPVVRVVQDIPRNVASVPAGAPVDFAAFPTPADCFWPVVTDHPSAMVVSYRTTGNKLMGGAGRQFLANRQNGARHHVGLDVYCKEGDVVLACADGRIVAFFKFYTTSSGELSFALLIEHAGVVINYGEVRRSAPQEFGWAVGDVVRAGQRIARVSSTAMIHFETYVPGTRRSFSWMKSAARPASLLNPTKLLLHLATAGKRMLVGGGVSVANGHAVIVQPDGKDLRDLDLLTLARTVYGEARGEKPEGRQAVASVVLNRARIGPRRYLKTIAGVCHQKSQFSCWNPSDPNRAVIAELLPGANQVFDACYDVSEKVVRGQLPDNTGGATHYYANYISAPFWTASPARRSATIGRHLFFTGVR